MMSNARCSTIINICAHANVEKTTGSYGTRGLAFLFFFRILFGLFSLLIFSVHPTAEYTRTPVGLCPWSVFTLLFRWTYLHEKEAIDNVCARQREKKPKMCYCLNNMIIHLTYVFFFRQFMWPMVVFCPYSKRKRPGIPIKNKDSYLCILVFQREKNPANALAWMCVFVECAIYRNPIRSYR